MAQITLGPNEEFEHVHSHHSYTGLVKGKGVLKMKGKVMPMKAGKLIKIPAGMPHTLINIGTTAMRVRCIHPAGGILQGAGQIQYVGQFKYAGKVHPLGKFKATGKFKMAGKFKSAGKMSAKKSRS
jgi:hypothetical protein